MKPVIRFLFFLFLILIFDSCINKDENYIPKPKGYFRIDLPEHSYLLFDTILPFSFEYSKDAICSFQSKENGKYWIDISYPALNASFNITYIPLHNDLRELVLKEDKMIKFHIDNGKADNVELSVIEDHNLSGNLYDLSGKEVACPLQFWLTDSVNHFLRASLYFNFAPNNDSLQPVIQFLREDALNMINTFSWKK